MKKGVLKLFSLVLAMLLLASFMIGCSKSVKVDTGDQSSEGQSEGGKEAGAKSAEEEPGPVEEEPTYDFGGRIIKSAAWWDSKPVEGTSQRADDTIARTKELEEKFNMKLEYVHVPWDQYFELFTSSTLAGEPFADYAYVSSVWFWPTLVMNGFLRSLDDLGVFDFSKEKWNQDAISFGTYNGHIYAMNIGKPEPRGVFWWNKDLFEREGLPNLYELQAKKEWSWDKMLEIAQKATKDLDGDGITDQWGVTGINMGWVLLMSNGGEPLIEENGRYIVGLNQPKAIEGLQFWQDLVHVHKVAPLPPEGAEWAWENNLFKAGKAAMLYGMFYNGDDFGPTMEEDYGMVVPPMGPQADGYISYMADIVVQVFPASVNKPEEVAIFYDAFTEPYPDDDPENWINVYEARVRDRESLQTGKMIVDEKLSKINLWNNISELQQMGWTFMDEIYKARKTPQAAIDAFVESAQAVLDEVVNKN